MVQRWTVALAMNKTAVLPLPLPVSTPQALEESSRILCTTTRECRDHGVQQMYMGRCPKCAEEIANQGPVRTIKSMMATSLEALAARLR